MNTTRSNKMGSFMLLFLMLKSLLCDCTRTLLHTPKTLETCKKLRLVWFKKLQGVRQIARLKRQRFSAFTSYKTQRSYEESMGVYFLLHWFSGENCMFLRFLRKGRQTSKELKRNMNDGTVVLLMSLLIVFLLKKRLWHRWFPVNFANFL